jgi:hypothetical protein
MKDSGLLWGALAAAILLLMKSWKNRRARAEAEAVTIRVLPKKGITAEQMAARVEANPANADLLKFFRGFIKDEVMVAETPPPTSPIYGMGMRAHPDIVNDFYNNISKFYLDTCDWSVYLHPALIHPETGFIFGLAIMMSSAIRLEDSVAKEAVEAGAAQVFLENYRLHFQSHAPPDIPGTGWVVINQGHALAGRLYKLAYENAGGSSPRKRSASPGRGPLWDKDMDS